MSYVQNPLSRSGLDYYKSSQADPNNKGYFATLSDLTATLPVGQPGRNAYVGNEPTGPVTLYLRDVGSSSWISVQSALRVEQPFTNATSVTINHNFGKYPGSVNVYDSSGEDVFVQVTNPNVNQTVCDWNVTESGIVVLLA